ncbi:MAG: DUF6178 family protein [Pseudomonadota bacterium]
MNEQNDYRLVNQQNRELKLRAQRHDIINADSETALAMILDAPAPATLIQSFPDQDLYYLMHKIGPDDFIPILSMATSDQWEYILDVDVWDNDRLDVPTLTKVFDVLFQADPQRLLRWVITQKPDFFEFYLFKNMNIFIREHDDIPPEDFDDYITLDDKFYFRFPDKPDLDDDQMAIPEDGEHAWELIETMLKCLADMDLSVFHGLLLETAGMLTAETEEEQFRLRTLRLAEKGFLPTHEAIGIYQPTTPSSLSKRPESLSSSPSPFNPDIPLPPQFFSGFMQGDNLFIKSLQLFDPQVILVLESELAALINKVISADKIKLRSKEALEKAISKTCDYLNLGLELLSDTDPSPAKARAIIEEHFLENIFRTGSRAGIQLKSMAQKWFNHSFMNQNQLPLSFLSEKYLGVIGGLLIDRPLYFNELLKGDRYRNFKTISDILTTKEQLDQIIAIDTLLNHMDVDIQSFTHGILTYKTLILTLWAKDRLNMEKSLDPIPISRFKPFFTALFAPDDTGMTQALPLSDLTIFIQETTGLKEEELPEGCNQVINNLIHELGEEYGTVNPNDLDPRFICHFILKTDKPEKP